MQYITEWIHSVPILYYVEIYLILLIIMGYLIYQVDILGGHYKREILRSLKTKNDGYQLFLQFSFCNFAY